MSTVRASTYQDASGGSNAVFSGVASPPNSMGFRNRIINGEMTIDQRNAGASVTPTNGQYFIDRYQAILSQASKYSVQQVSDAPTGFSYSMKITSLSAYSVISSDIFHVLQKIEGFNVADLAWGTASAQTVTFSFWAKSSLTGTFGGSLVNSAEDRSYPFSYTINAANTWEYKTVTVAGDTTGTWLTTNGIGIRCHFTIGMGSTYTATAGAWTAGAKFAPTGATSVVGTNGATLQVTGVQLEAGTVASPFERIDYGRELMMCQRYYEKSYDVSTVPATATSINRVTSSGHQGSATTGYIETGLGFKVSKRAAPSVTAYDQSGNSGKCNRLSTGVASTANQSVSVEQIGENYCVVVSTTGTSANSLQYHYVASSEL